MEKKKLLIFDYDDTIIYRDLSSVFDDLPNPPDVLSLLQRQLTPGADLADSIKLVLKGNNFLYDQATVNKYVRRYVSCFESGKITPRVKELLSRLSKKFFMVILSNGSKRLKLKELEANSLANVFDDIITPKEAGVGKPSSEAFLYVLKKHNYSPEKTIAIGNSLSQDILPAKSLGIKTIWLPRGAADLVKGALDELSEDEISKL